MATKKRVVLCTYPSLYTEIVLAELLRAPALEVTGVVCSTRVLNKHYSAWYASLKQIRHSGLWYAVYLWVVTGLYHGASVCTGRSLFRLLQQRNIPVLSTRDINDPQGLAFLQAQQPDVLLCAHFNQLMGRAILEYPGWQCLNIHPSLLPAYKGVDPAFYALLHNEQRTGATLHLQAESFDSGDILSQSSLKIRWHDSLLSLNIKLFKLGAVNAVQHIIRPDSAIVQPRPQTQAGHYDSWPDAQTVKQFCYQRKLWRWREVWVFIRSKR